MLYHQFKTAASLGEIENIDKCCKDHPNDVKKMISYNHFEIFHIAIQNGHLKVTRRLVEILSGNWLDKLLSGYFNPFRKVDNNVHAMVCSNDFKAFQLAAQNGHLELINILIQWASGNIWDMLRAGYLNPFRWQTKIIQDMLCANQFAAFRLAAQNGHLQMINKLIEMSGDRLQDMLCANQFEAFRLAAQNGHLPIINKLIEITPVPIEQMLRSQNYYAFIKSAANGHIQIVNQLIQCAPHYLVQKMISASDSYLTPLGLLKIVKNSHYAAVAYAANHQHIDVMNRLIELSDTPLDKMLDYKKFKLFHQAIQKSQVILVKKLMQNPRIFDAAEKNWTESKYRFPVMDFIIDEFEHLMLEINTFRAQKPNEVFDIKVPEKAKLYFYISRNLIRQQTQSANNQLKILLEIPSVLALAHENNNELLRFAMSFNDKQSVSSLLAIPQVLDLAKKNHYYSEEQANHLNIPTMLISLTEDIIEQEVRETIQAHFIHRINPSNYQKFKQAYKERCIDDKHFKVLNELNFTEDELSHCIITITQKLEKNYGPKFNLELKTYLLSKINISGQHRNLAEQFALDLEHILEQKKADLSFMDQIKEYLQDNLNLETYYNFFAPNLSKKNPETENSPKFSK